MHMQSHSRNHPSHVEYLKCPQPEINVYVDDWFATVTGDDINIWKHVTKYIETMKQHYHSNKLFMNISKNGSNVTNPEP